MSIMKLVCAIKLLMMNILRLQLDVFYQLIIIQHILKIKNVLIANMDFLKQKMNLVYIAKQEKMEDQNVINANI